MVMIITSTNTSLVCCVSSHSDRGNSAERRGQGAGVRRGRRVNGGEALVRFIAPIFQYTVKISPVSGVFMALEIAEVTITVARCFGYAAVLLNDDIWIFMAITGAAGCLEHSNRVKFNRSYLERSIHLLQTFLSKFLGMLSQCLYWCQTWTSG